MPKDSYFFPLHNPTEIKPKPLPDITNLSSTTKPAPNPTKPNPAQQSQTQQPSQTTPNQKPNLTNLANDTELSIETIAKQAKRISKSNIDKTDETFISLH